MMELCGVTHNADPEHCIGLLWEGKVSSFLEDGSIHSNSSLILLEGRSCTGCAKCEGQKELILEDVGAACQNSNILPDIEDGKLYRLNIFFVRDFESGYEEIDGYDFVEVDK